MRAKLVTLGVAVVVVAAMVFEVSTVTFANQENANKPAMTKKKRTRKAGRKSRMMGGVPMGVDKCLNHLAQMAAADPLIDYEGHPSEIINNGLLWNDPKSKCAITDATQRAKVFELANAWRMKDAAKVRSTLQELGASSGGSGAEAQPAAATSSTEPAAATPRRRPRRPRRNPATPPAETPAAPETQAAPPTEGTANGNRPARRRRPARSRNANTANSNSGF